MKIMVTLDGSTFSEAIVGPVARLAQEANAEVFLVRVIDPSEAGDIVTTNRELEDAMRGEHEGSATGIIEDLPHVEVPQTVEFADQVLESIINQAADYLHHVGQRFAPIHPQAVVLPGHDVDNELVKFAVERGMDLIAMASHGRTGVAEMILGSHAHRIMQRRVAPVLIVRPDNLHSH